MDPKLIESTLGYYFDTPFIFSIVLNPDNPNIPRTSSIIASIGTFITSFPGEIYSIIGFTINAIHNTTQHTQSKKGLAPAINIDRWPA